MSLSSGSPPEMRSNVGPASGGAVPDAARPSLQPGAILILTLTVALATCLLELSILLGHKLAGAPAHLKLRLLHPTALLLAPVAYVGLFLAVGGILLAVRSVRPDRGGSPRLVYAVLLGTAAWAILCLYAGTLGIAAATILAAGIGLEAARRLEPRAHGVQGRAQRVLPGLAVITALIGVGGAVSDPLREKLMGMGGAPAAAGAPNVLLIVLDTFRGSTLGAAAPGGGSITPNLDRLAERGVRFDQAFSTSTWTLPSHATLFTGLYPRELGVTINTPVPSRSTTLPEYLADRGYQTAGFVANIYYTARDLGLSTGFSRYEDYPVSTGSLVLASAPGRAISNHAFVRRLVGSHEIVGRKTAGRMTDDVLDWFEGRSGKQAPYFVFINYYDTHEPYLPPEPYRTRFARPGPDVEYEFATHRVGRFESEGYSSAQIEYQRGGYEGAAAYTDAEVGRLLDELSRQGALQNTIVILTADHGEAFGEHGAVGHFDQLNAPVLRVPLILSFEGRAPAGARFDTPVTTRDIAATIVDLAVATDPAAFPGRSLAAHWRPAEFAAVSESPVLSEIAFGMSGKSIVVGRHRFYEWNRAQGAERGLYDIHADPLEQNNLALTSEGGVVVERLERALRQALERFPAWHPIWRPTAEGN